MIGLDTNVLVRLLTQDDAAQAALVVRLFDANQGVDGALFISDVVVVEMAWILRARYDVAPPAFARAVQALLDNATIAWQSRDAVSLALVWFESRAAAEFADCLIVALAHRHGCTSTATFDRGMTDLPDVRTLG